MKFKTSFFIFVILLSVNLISAKNNSSSYSVCYSSSYSVSGFYFIQQSDSIKLTKLDVAARPKEFKLYRSKDPLDAISHLYFDVPESSNISMKMYDEDSELIGVLFDKEFETGTYVFEPYKYEELSSRPNGVYRIVMTAGSFSASAGITYVKTN